MGGSIMASQLPPGFTVNQPEQGASLPQGFTINQQPETTLAQDVIGGLETGASIVSGAIAEPIAGVAGIVQALNPLADKGAGAEAVQATKEAFDEEGWFRPFRFCKYPGN